MSDMLRRAEMRWMSVEDAEITVSARELAELGRERDRLRKTLILADDLICAALTEPGEHPVGRLGAASTGLGRPEGPRQDEVAPGSVSTATGETHG